MQLLDCFPDLRLTADVSHYLVGREFAWPVDEVNHRLIYCILDHSWAFTAGSPAASRCRSRWASRSIRAGSNCSWAGGNTPSAPASSRKAGGGADLPVRTWAAALRHHRTRRCRVIGPLGRRNCHEGHDQGAVAADRYEDAHDTAQAGALVLVSSIGDVTMDPT